MGLIWRYQWRYPKFGRWYKILWCRIKRNLSVAKLVRSQNGIHDAATDDVKEVRTTITLPSQFTAKKQRLEKTTSKSQQNDGCRDSLVGLVQVSESEADKTAFWTGRLHSTRVIEKDGHSCQPVANTSLLVSVGKQKINDLCDRLLRRKKWWAHWFRKSDKPFGTITTIHSKPHLATQKIKSYMAKAMTMLKVV